MQRIKLFTPEQCLDLIEQFHTQPEPGRVGGNIVEHIRSNSVCWRDFNTDTIAWAFPEHDWIANPVQLSRYAPGEYYHWHQDVIRGRSSERRYTLTVTLQPAEGADIEIADTVYPLNTGEGIVFPSEVQHRATAPIRGTRYALTVWAMRRVHAK